jgi:hypothetical protein
MLIGILIALGIFTAFIIFILVTTSRRRDALLARYNDPEVVEKIMHECVWGGQTADQLADALGRPRDVERRELPHLVQEVWRYDSDGLRKPKAVILEYGKVVEWE